jgi:hypothetical protein
MVLAGLRAIEWDKLTHAYGSAADVPDLLEEFLSNDPQTIHDAAWELQPKFLNQETVFEAAVFAIPFLIELLEHLALLSEAKKSILAMLRGCAKGITAFDKLRNSPAGTNKNEPEIAPKQDESEAYALAAHEAVKPALPACIQLLVDPDEMVVEFAAHVLGNFPEEYAILVPAFHDALLQTQDFRKRVHLIMSLGSLSADIQIPDPEMRAQYTPFIAAGMATSQHPAVCLASARCLIQWLRQDTPDEALELVMKEERKIWGDHTLDRPGVRVLEVFQLVGAVRGLPAIRQFLSQIDAADSAHRLVVIMLDWLLGKDMPYPLKCSVEEDTFIEYEWEHISYHEMPRLRTYLTYPEFAYLTAILNHDAFWQIKTNLLAFYGLPSHREELADFLAVMNPLKTNL